MLKQVALSQLKQRSNYREEYDQQFVEKLASDMSTNGFKVEYPIVTYQDGDLYIVIDGNTRFTAATLASSYSIKDHTASLLVWIVVKDKPSDQQFILEQLAANELRRDPDPLSQAKGYKQAVDAGATVETIASETGHQVEYVNRRLWLLDLVPEAQKLVANGNLGIKYGEAMHTLDVNFQRIALQAYNTRKVRTHDEFSALCNELLQKQTTLSLFDLSLFNGQPIEMVVDMSKVKTEPKVDASAVIRSLESELATEKAQRQADRDYAKKKYAELMSLYNKLQAQVSGPLFAQTQ